MTRRSRWLLRIMTVVVVGLNIRSVLGSPWWMILISTVVIVLLVGSQIFTEFRWREMDRLRWQLAADADDPIAALAQHDYIRRLSMRQMVDFTEYIAEHPEVFAGELEDAPPMVRDFFLIPSNAPREDS